MQHASAETFGETNALLPFDATVLQQALEREYHDAALTHVHQAPDPLTPQCPGAPEMLCMMIEKMISKKPSDRFANMQAVKGAIEHIAKDIKKRARR